VEPESDPAADTTIHRSDHGCDNSVALAAVLKRKNLCSVCVGLCLQAVALLDRISQTVSLLLPDPTDKVLSALEALRRFADSSSARSAAVFVPGLTAAASRFIAPRVFLPIAPLRVLT
jgi:hypothetical protein